MNTTIRRLLAGAAVIMLTGPAAIVAPPKAEAAIWDCNTGNESKVVNGVVSYRAYARCFGTLPNGAKYFRIKGTFSILGTGQGDYGPFYGSWVKSGSKSVTKWVAWPYWTNAEGRKIESKK